MNKYKQEFGSKGEDIAADFLAGCGYKIIERNYRFGHGEIDIIARDGDTLVFVEVKTRKDLEFGYPELNVTKGKQKQIRKIAEAYLYDKKISETDCRIDVIAILNPSNDKPQIEHIINAF